MILASNADLCAQLHNAPGTFAGLMDLYERNYIGIRRLIPELPSEHVPWVSRVPGGLSLHMEVLDTFRYTTELSLTYYFIREQSRMAEPDLRIRIYHDARLAEVMAAQLRHRPEFRAAEHEWEKTPLRARWHVNRFLYKWLNYCLHQGHRFGNTG